MNEATRCANEKFVWYKVNSMVKAVLYYRENAIEEVAESLCREETAKVYGVVYGLSVCDAISREVAEKAFFVVMQVRDEIFRAELIDTVDENVEHSKRLAGTAA